MSRIAPRQILGVGLLAATTLLAVNQVRTALDRVWTWWGYAPLRRPGYSDFGNYYLYARMGVRDGWGTLYNLAVQRHEWLALGGVQAIPWYPMMYPPPLAWAMAPFTLLPLPEAFALWSAMLLATFVLIWRMLVEGSRLQRWTHFAAAFALFPVVFMFLLGQILLVVLAAVAVAWWLLERRRETLAGIVLVLTIFKPQVAFLLPFTLLVAGRWRTAATALAGIALITAAAALSVGGDGIRDYLGRVVSAAAAAPEFYVPIDLTLRGVLGGGLLAAVGRVAVVILTLAVAYRHRKTGVAIPMAAGLVGSLVVTPYLHYQDLSGLLVAGWLALRQDAGRSARWILAAGYALLLGLSYWEFAGPGHPSGAWLVLLEVTWLAVVLGLPPAWMHRLRRHLDRPESSAPSRLAA